MFSRFIRHVKECLSIIYLKKLTVLRSLLVLVAPLASALSLTTPTGVVVGGLININWTTVPSDPYVNRTLPLFPFLLCF